MFEVSDAEADRLEELEGDSWVGATVEGLGNGILLAKRSGKFVKGDLWARDVVVERDNS